MLKKTTISLAITLAACASIEAESTFVDPSIIPGVDRPVVSESTDFQSGNGQNTLTLKKDSSICFIGGGLGSRMAKFNYFETELYLWLSAFSLKQIQLNVMMVSKVLEHMDRSGKRNDMAEIVPKDEDLDD